MEVYSWGKSQTILLVDFPAMFDGFGWFVYWICFFFSGVTPLFSCRIPPTPAQWIMLWNRGIISNTSISDEVEIDRTGWFVLQIFWFALSIYMPVLSSKNIALCRNGSNGVKTYNVATPKKDRTPCFRHDLFGRLATRPCRTSWRKFLGPVICFADGTHHSDPFRYSERIWERKIKHDFTSRRHWNDGLNWIGVTIPFFLRNFPGWCAIAFIQEMGARPACFVNSQLMVKYILILVTKDLA